MPSDDAVIASHVRAELAKARVTGRKLAEHMGWRADSTGRRLRGEIPFRAGELASISRYLGVPIEKFYDDVTVTPPRGMPAVTPRAAS